MGDASASSNLMVKTPAELKPATCQNQTLVQPPHPARHLSGEALAPLNLGTQLVGRLKQFDKRFGKFLAAVEKTAISAFKPSKREPPDSKNGATRPPDLLRIDTYCERGHSQDSPPEVSSDHQKIGGRRCSSRKSSS